MCIEIICKGCTYEKRQNEKSGSAIHSNMQKNS